MADADVTALREELARKEDDVYRAAKFGKALLEENEEMKAQLKKNVHDYSNKIEDLEQEKHTLRMKLESKSNMQEIYAEENGNLKQDLMNMRQQITDSLEAEYSIQQNKAKHQIASLQNELELCGSNELHLREQVGQLECLILKQLEQTENLNTTLNWNETSMLEKEMLDVQNENTSLKSLLIEAQTECHRAKKDNECLHVKVSMKESEIEEVQCQMTSYARLLERAHTDVLDLKAQLDAVRMTESGHQKAGNSLFGELEDRRIKAEKLVITIRVNLDALKTKYEVECQQNHKLKMQMVALLQLSSSRADSSHVTQLQSKLSEARGDIQVLTEQLQQREQTGSSDSGRDSAVTEACGDDSSSDYKEYVTCMLKGKDTEIMKLKQVLHDKSLRMLEESNMLSVTERKLFDAECEREKLRSQNMKLVLKNEDLLLKYDPDCLKKNPKLLKKNPEKISLIKEGFQVIDKPCNNTFPAASSRGQRAPLEHTHDHFMKTQYPDVFEEETQNREAVCKRDISDEENVGKKVSISDNAEAIDSNGEKENIPIADETRDLAGKHQAKPKAKGRQVHKVQQVQASQHTTNDCKNQ